jgi:uracil-DNA glycosylase
MKNIDQSWLNILHLDIFNNITNIKEIKDDSIPSKEKLLLPFTFFKLNELKIVFIGQDPYSNPNYANGLAFSVNKNIKIPQTLANIFKEINIEYKNKFKFTHGDLSKWSSREKILLLNTSFTTLKNESNTHKKIWREYFNLIIKEISSNTNNVCFVLFGNHSREKKYLIDEKKHTIIESIHPSPNSAFQGFFNSGIFKKIEKCSGITNWRN